MTNQPNVSWPGWEVVRTIGHGSFGAVYEIQRNTFGHVESAALKVISIPDKASDIEDLYNDGYTVEDVTMRFQSYLEDIIREYSLMVDMKGHSNVVYCDDFRYVQHEDGIGWDIYIKMELLTPLTKALPKTIEERQVIDLGVDICNALVMCKESNIVHRDIKPQNIFVSKDGTHKLGDFGIAKTAERTTSGTKIGTYKYMAPEVYNNKPYGAGADIYSLGLLMYWMLNERRTPFLPLPPQVPSSTMEDEARKRRLQGEKIPAPAHGSERLKAIVLKACAYDPKDRFASAAEMREALLHLRDGAAAKDEDTIFQEQSDDVGIILPVDKEDNPVKPFVTIRFLDEGVPVKVSNYRIGEKVVVPYLSKEIVHNGESLRFVKWEPAIMETALVDAEYTAVYEKTVASASDKSRSAPKKHKPVLWIALAAVLALTVTLVIFIGGNTKPPVVDDESSQNTIIDQPTNNQSNNNQPTPDNKEDPKNQDAQTPPPQSSGNPSQSNKNPAQTPNTPSCTSHTFNGGICSDCGYEWPHTVTNITAAQYSIIDEAGAWTRPYENNSTKEQQLQLGTVVTVVASTKNQAGNVWYKMDNGLWVYGGNLGCSSHSYSGGICKECNYEWPYTVTDITPAQYSIIDQAGAWTRPYENNSTNKGDMSLATIITVVAYTKNQAGNLWYKMDNGLWVYGENFGCASHSYSGGICKECNYEWPYTVTSISAAEYRIIDQAGAWTRPYENNSTNKGDMPLGSIVTVIASAKNQAGNLWYKMDNGLWVYSGNLEKVS